ncbi:hypothetical protein [Streptomyces sp. G45]|uniref:hypothetical protein n=1 Tax=Streptomyces sp. G45 TaxID=3406627 RepID=UPI003C2097C1
MKVWRFTGERTSTGARDRVRGAERRAAEAQRAAAAALADIVLITVFDSVTGGFVSLANLVRLALSGRAERDAARAAARGGTRGPGHHGHHGHRWGRRR